MSNMKLMMMMLGSYVMAALLLLRLDQSVGFQLAPVSKIYLATKSVPTSKTSPIFSSTSSSSPSSSTNEIVEKVNGLDAPKTEKKKFFSFENLRAISNIAGILCILDCTLLPIITVALPLLGILDLSPVQMDFLHILGHRLAIFFVVPVGGLTGVINYLSHKKAWITSLSVIGLVLVGLANSHVHSLPLVGHVHWLHTIQHGILHRFANTFGCALLLGSNYLSQKQPGCAHGHECGHDHGHAHHDHEH